MVMIFLTFLVSFLLFTPSRPQNSVTVSMDAKWANTPFVAEISEFLAAEDMSLFWRYLDGLSPLVIENKLAPTEDEESVYSAVLTAARPLLSPSLLPLLLLSLSSRAYSPAVEMNHQLDLASQSQIPSFPCPSETPAWAMVGLEAACSPEQLQSLLASEGAGGNETEVVMLLKTDKVYRGTSGGRRVAVLYGDVRDKRTHEMHSLLKKGSSEGKVKYVFRHRVIKVDAQRTRLSGYGVELAIKSTEYKAMDDSAMSNNKKGADSVAGFDFSVLRTRYPNLTKELSDFRQYLLDSATEMVELKAWQLQDLSFQAAQRIASVASKGDEAITVLADLSQNFPIRAHSLSQVTVASSFRSEVQRLQNVLESQLGLGPGSCAMFVNGYLLNDLDSFSLLELLRRESRVMEGLHRLGITGVEINQVIRTPLSSSESSSKFALDIREMPLVYLNDLEDGSSRYYGWPSSVRSLLEQTLPGMLRRVAKNLFNLVLVLDPAEVDTWQLLRYAQAFVVHAAPVRIGVMWSVEEGSVGELMAKVFEYARRSEDEGLAGLEFLIQIIGEAEKDKESGGKVNRELIERQLKRRFSNAKLERVLDSSDYGNDVKKAREYLIRSGLSPKLSHVMLNGMPLDRHQVKDMFEETVIGAILEQTPVIQRDVYEGTLNDHQSVVDHLMSKPDIVPRLNQLILDSENRKHLNLVRTEELSVQVADSLVYLMKKEDSRDPRSISIWLALDLNQPAARLCVYNALKVLRSSSRMRLALVHVGVAPRNGLDLAHIVQSALKFLPAHTARLFITKLVKEENVEELTKGTKSLEDVAVSDMDFKEFQKKMNSLEKDYRKLHSDFGTKTLQLTADSPSAVVVNGKVLGPLTNKQLFDNEDFRLLERVTGETGGADILAQRLRNMKGSAAGIDLSDLSMRVFSILQAANAAPETSMASATSKRRHAPLEMPALAASSEAVVRLYADVTQPAFELVVIIDPLTRDAQKMAGILAVLRNSVNCNVHIIFNCKSKLSESPLKNFYRLVWSPSPDHSSWGRGIFTDMPSTPLLTLGVDAPHAWMVAPVRSAVDLDNIRLLNVGRVSAHFQLEHLLLEGHCVDTVTGQPPRGLQFTLASKRGEADVDTIVMANLGYFQMKANPGAWFLQLRHGRSKDIYDISGHAYTDNMPDSPEVIAVIDSLRSKIIRVRVAKKADKLDTNLLGDDDDAGGVGSGIWSSISSAFGGKAKKTPKADEVLNIFSVASGHLYERFLRIMMLSVLKHTKQPVKFWFLKNYLSPSFKDFIPHMAKDYKFEYELVQYKWPRWLQHQTEKQRIIWGYKILFLDVLFPLDVHKIIFVDADQIVRTDLQELADFDLEGAPYGYTPFCDSRREMDGFRFWKSGYWAQHLGNRRYHISALYVVDLVRFRRLAAGDRLRGQYQGLSQDPNSLSNLDQDLPNNMIHQVPIKSLPQEWLWCETWCSTAELARAKTIDLCNNPQTKEPKLQAARRIVSEWTGYDEEVKNLWDKIYGSKPPAHGEEKHETEKKKDEL